MPYWASAVINLHITTRRTSQNKKTPKGKAEITNMPYQLEDNHFLIGYFSGLLTDTEQLHLTAFIIAILPQLL